MLVEPLQVQRGQVCQRNAADLRLDVVFQKALAGFEGRWAQLDFRIVFHPDLLAPICDSDFRLILLSALRYAMGKNTYMPVVVSDYIKRHIHLLDDKFLVLAADDIRRYLEDYAEHEPNSNLWQSLLGVLETEQRARATREARKIRPCPACGKPLEIMSIADSWHSLGGFDVIAHCRNCLADYEWFCDKDGGTSDMKQYFFG